MRRPAGDKLSTDALDFHRDVLIGKPAETVWNALIDPEIVRKYYLCPLKFIEPKIGGTMLYGSPTETFIAGQILEMEPGRLLVHSFEFSPVVLGAGAETDPPTRVRYQITPMGELCNLHLTHDGFASQNRTYHCVINGWDTILSSLKTVMETGTPVPGPKET